MKPGPTDSEILEFLLGQFSISSPKMDGKHSWRFRQGWPWNHARGPTIRDAVVAAMVEAEREREKA